VLSHAPKSLVSEMEDRHLISIEKLKQYYPVKGKTLFSKPFLIKAVDGVDLTIDRGEIMGLVGESGCGKSTLCRLVLGLEEPTGGSVLFEGRDLSLYSEKEFRLARRFMQLIFQDPYSSLNPRKSAGAIIEEPLIIHGLGDRKSRRLQVEALMKEVGLNPDQAGRYPHEFSGGERQRIGIARALALQPRFIVADEPVSALDVSIQAQIVNLLLDLQERFHLTYLFVSHDLNVVEAVSDHIAVMYLGKIMEVVERRLFGSSVLHPYTEALLAAAPVAAPGGRRKKTVLKGEIPSAVMPPSGCVFRTRCSYAEAVCAEDVPLLRQIGPNHKIACHLR
jgi:oligopeptide transport system ATP-binding protein